MRAGPREDLTSDNNYKSFMWLVEHLLSTHDKVHGCEVLIPETYFFAKGKPKFMVKVDKEKGKFLTSVKTPEKLELTEIRKDLPMFIRTRKENIGSNQPESYNSNSNIPIEYPPDIAKIFFIPEEGRQAKVQILAEK